MTEAKECASGARLRLGTLETESLPLLANREEPICQHEPLFVFAGLHLSSTCH